MILGKRRIEDVVVVIKREFISWEKVIWWREIEERGDVLLVRVLGDRKEISYG